SRVLQPDLVRPFTTRMATATRKERRLPPVPLQGKGLRRQLLYEASLGCVSHPGKPVQPSWRTGSGALLDRTCGWPGGGSGPGAALVLQAIGTSRHATGPLYWLAGWLGL